MTDVFLLLVGGFCLYIGAEWLVRGASGLAGLLGVRPLVIGLTVVAYGTSAPELVVGVGAALSHKGAIAFGNSVGSNIANLGLILGVTAILAPPKIDPAIRRRELPVLVGSTLAIPLVLLDGRISRVEAAFLLGSALLYTLSTLSGTRVNRADVTVVQQASETAGAPRPQTARGLVAVATVGLCALLGGGKLFVQGASAVAHALGMSDRVVGLTVVALGTSAPELATSIVAARRGHADVAVGNVIGSNIFNTLLILGAAGMVGSIEQPLRDVTVDLVALGLFTAVGVLAMLRPRVSRAVGVVLVCGYAVFLLVLAFVPWVGAAPDPTERPKMGRFDSKNPSALQSNL